MKELDQVMSGTRKQAKDIKKLLDQLKEENEKYEEKHPGSTLSQMKKNLLNTNIMHFRETMQDYEKASLSFRKALKDRICRQARIGTIYLFSLMTTGLLLPCECFSER